ncbi:MAG: ribbon-helix-helix domain-containing protein [Actinobacteria bacterium]|nr:ribbon-helix-helix domain-containing protein [Actinomycetota bacterium]
MTTQIAVKVPDAVLETIDGLVAQGRYDNRSAAVRAALDMLTRHVRDDAIDRAFTDGFRRVPESPQELSDAYRLAIDAIEDEPWQPWW